MRAITYKSHKAGQGTTVTACASALALAGLGYRVALVTNDTDTRAVFALASDGDMIEEVGRGIRLFDVSRFGELDALALAGLVGLSDLPPRFDVIVTDLHDDTPTAATLAAHGFTAPHAVEVVTADYLALRRSTQATHAGAERRQHVALLLDEGRALTESDVKQVLTPSGEMVTLRRSTAVARQIDAGLLAHRFHADLDPLRSFVESLVIDPATLDAANRELVALKARRDAKEGTGE